MTCVLRDLMALHVIQHVMRASGDQTVMERVEHVKMKQHVTEKVANVQLRVSALLLKHYLTKSDNLDKRVNLDICHRFALKSAHPARLELIVPRLVIGKVHLKTKGFDRLSLLKICRTCKAFAI